MPQEKSPPLSSLSSVPTAYVDLLSNVQTRLDAYQSKARDVQDNTIPILRSLVKFLPRDGHVKIFLVVAQMRNLYSCSTLPYCPPCSLYVTLYCSQWTRNSCWVPIVKSRKQTPNITPSPRLGARDDTEEVSSGLAQSSQAWIKAACLERDGNRCVVTSYYDSVEALKKGFTARQFVGEYYH